ncbi:hypothetical protein I552_0182 [Mycobacterium xenopi 3993]|nr:hypothetical protein I552_0182 [Mycobacterium xenopi 3993]
MTTSHRRAARSGRSCRAARPAPRHPRSARRLGGGDQHGRGRPKAWAGHDERIVADVPCGRGRARGGYPGIGVALQRGRIVVAQGRPDTQRASAASTERPVTPAPATSTAASGASASRPASCPCQSPIAANHSL